jgi:hypothetical protein
MNAAVSLGLSLFFIGTGFSTVQDTYTPADFINISAGSLRARFDDAVSQGRRGTSDTFWIAYQMPPSHSNNYISVSDGIEVVRQSSSERLAMFLLTRKSDGGIDKLRPVHYGDDLRVHDRKVYWLGEPSGEESARLLLDIARNSASTQVKKDAVFWLAQEMSRQAGEELEKLATTDPEVEVQKQVVFALSLRKNDEAIPALERIATNHPNSTVRKQAIFWLGQKRDPRVIDFFEQMLKKN